MSRRWSEEEKKCHSKIMREAMNRPEVKERQRKTSNRPEVKKHRSERQKEVQNRPEVRQKKSESTKRMHNYPGMREKYSEGRKEFCKKHPEVGKKHGEMIRKKWQNLDLDAKKYYKERIREAMNRPEVRQKLREKTLIQFANMTPEDRGRHMLRARKALKRFSKGQLQLYDFIHLHFPTAKSEFYVSGKFLDIAIPELKINIEYDGAYWHQNPEKDEARDKTLQKLGWMILRIKEGESFDIDMLHNLVKGKSNVA